MSKPLIDRGSPPGMTAPVVRAAGVAAARRQVLGTLSTYDAARPNLEHAIAAQPELVTPPAALVAWHH